MHIQRITGTKIDFEKALENAKPLILKQHGFAKGEVVNKP